MPVTLDTANVTAQALIQPTRGFYPSDTANPPNTIIPPPLLAQVTVREVHHDKLTITDHPVEQGTVIADHAFRMPAEVTLEVGWSDSPSIPLTDVDGSALLGNQPGQSTAIYNYLLNLLQNRILFVLYTGKRPYGNMLVQEITVETDVKTENALFATVHCREILIAQTQLITIGAPASAQQFSDQTQSTSVYGQSSLTDGSKFIPLPAP